MAFEHDLAPAGTEEISRCLEVLRFSRQDLLDAVEGLPDPLLDWDPPYRQFEEWAWWRTIRQILKHVALTETGYYLPAIGYPGPSPSRVQNGDWKELLSYSRRETERYLVEVAASSDRARVTEAEEVWSVRKVLRRLVWHELLHWKSIKRIVKAYHNMQKLDS